MNLRKCGAEQWLKTHTMSLESGESTVGTRHSQSCLAATEVSVVATKAAVKSLVFLWASRVDGDRWEAQFSSTEVFSGTSSQHGGWILKGKHLSKESQIDAVSFE